MTLKLLSLLEVPHNLGTKSALLRKRHIYTDYMIQGNPTEIDMGTAC